MNVQPDQDQFDRVAPTTGYVSRLSQNFRQSWSRKLRNGASRLPGLAFLKPESRQAQLQSFHSGSDELLRWYRAPYGTDAKPPSLEEMPWAYMEEQQEKIPFFGLREFWYPALEADKLPSNEPVPIRMLGDNIVLFRDGEGAPCALENRCPHRNPLLSLGQVNVWEPGTITCRYHGMTFDKEGSCVAFLADGPDSRACGKGKLRSYRAQEYGGMIWLYMGIKEAPDLKTSLPPGHEEIFGEGLKFCMRVDVPFSYLNLLDNTVDMTHVGCLHRSCFLFGDQKLGGGVKYEDLDNFGVHASLAEEGGHGGANFIDEIRWYPPNLVHHGNELLEGGMNAMWFWAVPIDAGSFRGWQIGNFNTDVLGKRKAKMMRKMVQTAFLRAHRIPGVACFEGGDAPIQMSQGRVPRWDQERLAATDRAVVKVRTNMRQLHEAEIKYRESQGHKPLMHRVSSKQFEVESDLSVPRVAKAAAE